jgi:transcriptional regulator with PAS, ATPase and Fis domain
MKVDVYLVKDEYSTVANFRCSSKATDYAAKNKNYIVERIEVEVPQFRYHSTVKVKTILVVQQDDVKVSPTDKLEDVIDTHILNVYRKLKNNKTHTAKAVGITTKTVAARIRNMGEV